MLAGHGMPAEGFLRHRGLIALAIVGAVAEACLGGAAKVERFIRLGLKDGHPDLVGDQAYLRARHGLDRHAVARALREVLELA